MTGREKAGMTAAAGLIMAAAGYAGWQLCGTGVLSWHVRQPEFFSMVIRLAVVWCLLFLVFFCGKTRGLRVAGCLGILAGFAWLHQVFLPVLAAALYAGYLTALGHGIHRKLVGWKGSLCWDYLTGGAVTVAAFCLLSLMGQGGIRNLRLWVAGTGILLAGAYLAEVVRRGGGMKTWCEAVLSGIGGIGKKNGSEPAAVPKSQAKGNPFLQAILLASIGTLLLLQLGRMNGAVDFDSLWYGVRSDTMLNTGRGIYENLGTLGVVYTYPKGWETLTLPLAGLPSYSFSIGMNWVTAGFVLLAAFETACVWMKRSHALVVPALLAAIPGIMNMADTAKADLMTLFLQALLLQAVLEYEKQEDGTWIAAGLSAYLFSLTMKPTAVIFSTAIAGMGVLWILIRLCGKRRRKETILWKTLIPENRRLWLVPGICLAALAGIWGRTLYLVGVPVTSVFYQLFQRLGFSVKYPFYAAGFPSAGGGMSLGEAAALLGRRLNGVLLNPQGDDMAHVIIAWGTVLPLAFLILWAALRLAGSAGRTSSRLLPALVVAVAFINLVSLYSLSQIDGNYYMLFYLLVVLAGCRMLERAGTACWRAGCLALLPAWLLAAVLCGLTNWAWALGFGPMQPVNRGYYNHQEAERQKRAEQGSGAIWEILAADPQNRVIALGEHPGVLTFPCTVQSYVDVSGYWGNPEVVADAASFLTYLHYAEIDYLYMEKEYVDTSVRIYQILRSLAADGWLTDVRDENGNLILTVGKDQPKPETAEQNLEIFDSRYIQHP